MVANNISESIWQVVALIPKGKVATYGQVATLAGYPGYARFVGYTLKNLPKGTDLPWHRVVNAQGKLSFPENSHAFQRQQTLLEKEGVVFKNMKIAMTCFAWKNEMLKSK